MEIDLKRNFGIAEQGTRYTLPVYEVQDGKGIVEVGEMTLPFVRGSKLADEEVERREGTLHEHLLACMIHDLKYKNMLVPSREGSLVITKLEEALLWLTERQIQRKLAGVDGTYQKHGEAK